MPRLSILALTTIALAIAPAAAQMRAPVRMIYTQGAGTPAILSDAAARAAVVRARTPAAQLAFADALAARHPDPAAVRGQLATALPGADIDALTFVVMTRIAQQSDADLRAMTAQMKATAGRKAAARGQTGGADAKSDMTEMDSLRLQAAMDRRSKMIETLSNLLKKMDQTQSGIVDNLK